MRGVNFNYRWTNGRLVPNIDKDLVHALDAELESIKANQDAPTIETNSNATENEEGDNSQVIQSMPPANTAVDIVDATSSSTSSAYLKVVLFVSLTGIILAGLLLYLWKRP